MFMRLFVWFAMIFGGGILSIYLDGKMFPSLWENIVWHVISFAVGVVLMKVVILVSKNTGRTLAKFGRRGEIKRMETNVLVTQGVYKYMRHPMHLGLLFFPPAFGFLLGSPTFILFVAPAEALFMLVMIKLFEEPEAIKKFGKEYTEYMKRTPWFCFKKECMKELFKNSETRF